MGAIWSQQASYDNQNTSTITLATSSTRKRPSQAEEHRPDTKRMRQSTTALSATILMDPTPDGNVHRYIVTCSSIFWCTRKDIVKILSKLPEVPPYGGLHKITKWDHFFITFPNQRCAEAGVRILGSHSFRDVKWEIRETTEHSAKRARNDENAKSSKRVSLSVMPDGVCPSAGDVTAKWKNLPYEDQILRKKHKWIQSLRLVSKHLRKEVRQTDRIPWLHELFSGEQGKGSPACCALEGIITADTENARMYYRNKNEFTIGLSPDACGMKHDYHKSEITVGYALGLIRDGQVFIGEVDDQCFTTSKTAIAVGKCLTDVIRASGLRPYDKRLHRGYWRQIICRESVRTGEVLVSVVVNPFEQDAEAEEPRELTKEDQQCRLAVVGALRSHFGSNRPFGVYWQPSSLKSAVSSDIVAKHLHGIEGIHESMCGLTFRIQPTAFFQVNTVMAEKLYQLIGHLAHVDESTAVFDVCCGTGTIGLSLAKKAHSVVGIEMNEAAVEDARYNAKLNGISNATFIAGKVEHKIHDAIRQIEGKRKCVVILDPPRAGLPMNVVAAVRGMQAVDRIVYVACEPNNFWKNALGFCRPRSKAFRLEPFKPVKAYGVDLFPHTDHGELAVLLERTTPPV